MPWQRRNRYVDARIEQWTHELERLAVTMSDGGLESILDDVANEDKENSLTLEDVASRALIHSKANVHGKLRALIELKSLRVLDKQQQMHAKVTERLTHGPLCHSIVQISVGLASQRSEMRGA